MNPKISRHLILCALGILIAAAAAAPLKAAESSAQAAKPAQHMAAKPPCDRECLKGFVDQYLAGLAARDASHLPVANDVKFTENSVPLKLGQGLWGTATALGTYKLYFADPASGDVGFMGVVKEWANPVILCLRLKVKDQKIREAETIVARDWSAAASLDKMGEPNPILDEMIPATEGASRAELVKTANMYFMGLQNNDGKGVYPFTDDCNRIENGTQTTNNPALDKTGTSGSGYPIFSMGCAAQFKAGFFRVVTRIRDRRFLIVDPDRGLVFAFAFFDHAGTVKTVTLTDGTTFPESLRHPLTWELGEVFKIEKGKIRYIQAVLTQAQYGLKPGWGPGTHEASARMTVKETSNDCDRACLNGLMDTYRAAVIEHDPSRLPLTTTARYTENGQDLKVGDGLWGTLTGWGSYKLYVDDPEDGEVGYLGVTDEAGMSGIIAARLKVEHKKISEIEVVITRKETPNGFTRPEGLSDPKPALAGFFEDVPEASRESRKDLITQTDLYFDGIEQGNGSIVPFGKDVIRIENGTQTCPSSFGANANKTPPPSCGAQLDTKIFNYISPISPRRYTVVDRQRGIVFGVFMFNTPGTVAFVDSPGVGKVAESAAAMRPFSEEVAEIFKINDGKIIGILAAMTSLPYGATSAWSQ
jgi:hypothetical protein